MDEANRRSGQAQSYPTRLPEKNTVLSSVSVEEGSHILRRTQHRPYFHHPKDSQYHSYTPGVSIKQTRDYGRNIHVLCCGEDYHQLKHLSANKHIAVNTFNKLSRNVINFLKRYVANLAADVWVYISSESSVQQSWIDMVLEFVQHRKIFMEPLKLPKTFDLRLLVQDRTIMHALPAELKNLNCVIESSRKDALCGEMLLSIYDKRLNNLSTIYIDTAPILVISMKLNSDGDENYTDRAYKMLIEVLEDSTSYARQEWQQLYKIPNVHIIRFTESPDSSEIHAEIRPTDHDHFSTFLQSLSRDTIQETLAARLIIQGSAFQGSIRIHHKPESVEDISHSLKQESANLSENKGLSLKSIIATRVYKEFLDDHTKTSYDYLKYWESEANDNWLLDICDPHGRNALHLAIQAQRIDFMWMIFYKNVWGVLRSEIIHNNISEGPSHSQRGYTPHRLGQALSYKVQGYEVLCEYDYIDQLWLSLPNIFKSCLKGTTDMIKIYVESMPQIINATDIYGGNCLLYACASGNANLVKYLVQKKASIDCRNRRKNSGLHIAAMFGHTSVLEELAETALDLRGQRDSSGYNALDYCAMTGNIASLGVYKNKNMIDAHALTVAVKFKKYDAIEYLLDKCNVDVDRGMDADGKSSIHYAVTNGDLLALRLLHANNVDIAKTDIYNKNVFHLAVQHNQPDIFNSLVQMAVDAGKLRELLDMQDFYTAKDEQFLVRGKDNGRRAWHWLELKPLHSFAFNKDLKSGQIDVARHGKIIMSAFGPSPNEEQMKDIKDKQMTKLQEKTPHWTPLHVAVDMEQVQMVENLLCYNAKVDVRDNFGVAPIHLACMRGNLEIVKMLESADADMEVKTNDDQSPENIAQYNNHQEVVNFLQGMRDINKAKMFLKRCLDVRHGQLSAEELLKKRDAGRSMKTYLVGILRDLTIDINELLVDLGSGPVMEES